MSDALQQFRTRLLQALREEVDSARALKAALALEKDAVGAFDPDGLADVALRKEESVAALQALSAARIDLMTRHGFEASREGVQACIEALSPCVDLTALFAQLGDLARECREDNRLVGRMINRRGQVIASALRGLGAQPNGRVPLYGGDGKALAVDSHRRVGRA